MADLSSHKLSEDPTGVSQQGPTKMDVEQQKATLSVEEASHALPELSTCGADHPLSKPLSKDQLATSFVDKIEQLFPGDQQERTLSKNHHFPSHQASSVVTKEDTSVMDMEERLLTFSDEEDEEEDDEQMKVEGLHDDIKQELLEQDIKPDLLLDETSNLSHGDESSSGFLGSPGELDSQLSMEFGLVPPGRLHADSLLTETDDSLPFEPLRSDRDKVKRRGSPGRSRVKQVISLIISHV